jgi:hypothetical protein
MRVLIGCEYSGTVRDAFTRRGHYAMSCDLRDSEKPGHHYKGSVLDVLDDGWDMAIFHPPCTRLTNAGVRWLHQPPKGRTVAEMWAELEEAAAFYLALRNAPIPKKALENPVMHPHAHERVGKPARFVVQPWWFGEPAFKATGFELIGLPPLVATNRMMPPRPGTEEHKRWSWLHRMPPGPHRERERSRTFPGIAEAMADQWGESHNDRHKRETPND